MNYSLLQAFGETRTCPNSKKRTVLMNFKTCVGFLQDIVISYTTSITPNSHDTPTIVNTFVGITGLSAFLNTDNTIA